MFGFLRKPNTAQEAVMAEYAIKRDLLLAERAHEDAKVLAARRREDWKLQGEYEEQLAAARGLDNV
jgi:hypothetical protein